MVNHGASRGCETCKKRRKKCDEGRPACERCIKSKRICPGYKDTSDIIFRHYDMISSHNTYEHSVLPSDGIETQSPLPESPEAALSDVQLEQRALMTFFTEFCVKSKDRSISRGFLDGIETIVAYAGPCSDIANAAKIVVLAAIGNKLGRKSLLRRTEQIYGALLHSFQYTLSSNSAAHITECLMTAVLLGLYEIMKSTEYSPDRHITHVNGISAILSRESSPFDLITGIQLFQLSNPIHMKESSRKLEVPGVLCAPISNQSVQSLDAILIKFNPVFHKANGLFTGSTIAMEAAEHLKQEAIELEHEFQTWSKGQVDEWVPKKVGPVDEYQMNSSQLLKCWPGDVETYLDLYVASVWNTYRKTYLMLLDIIVKCSDHLGHHIAGCDEMKRGQKLAQDIAASIPYHLTTNPATYLQELQTGIPTSSQSKPIGGLLLLHPLYTVARSTIASPQLRTYMTEILSWIGKNMGIGQATILSDSNTDLPFQYMAQGHVLIWAGMLIQPV